MRGKFYRFMLCVIGIIFLMVLIIDINCIKYLQKRKNSGTENSDVEIRVITNVPSISTTTKELDDITTTITTTAMKTINVTTKQITTTEVKSNVKMIISKKQYDEEENSTKYGTKVINIRKYEEIKYNDGTSEKNLLNSITKYDKSTFNATTNELKAEALNVVNKNSSTYKEVLDKVNSYRNEVGSEPLSLNNDLNIAATIRAMEMAYSLAGLSHTRPNGSSCFTVLSDLGINLGWNSGENIAYNYANASSVCNGWYNSSGHKENMLNSSYKYLGVGMYELNGIKYWVQIFVG